MKFKIFIDAYTFSYDGELNAEELDLYIGTISDYYELTKNDFFDIIVSPYTPVVLEEANSYPYWKRMTDIPQIQRRDVIAMIEGILKKGIGPETLVGCDYLLLEDVGCEPEDHIQSRPGPLFEHYHQILALCSLLIRASADSLDPAIATRGLPSAPMNVRCWGDIIDSDAEQFTHTTLPYRYDHSFLHVCRVHDIVSSIDPAMLWIAGLHTLALDVAISQHPSANYSWPQSVYQWRMHPHFLMTAGKLGFLHETEKAKQILKACTEVTIGVNQRMTHVLRTGKAATKPQRIRSADQVGAQRRDIDYEFHLHYWNTPSGPEFASIVVHEDFSIPE